MQAKRTLIVLSVLILVVYGQDATAPPFETTMCNGKICVGIVNGTLEWWVYYADSFEEDTNVLEDDEYLSVAPNNLYLSDGTTINLQQAVSTTAVEDFFTTEWNGAKALSLNYTLQSGEYTIYMDIYLLEEDVEIDQCGGFVIDLYDRDFVIQLNVVSSNSGTFDFDVNISHQDGCLEMNVEDSYDWFGYYDTCDSSGTQLGYQLGAPVYALSSPSTCDSVTSSTNATGLVRVSGLTQSSNTGYFLFVRSGSQTKIGWAILLSILGALVICCLVSTGLVGYYIRKRKGPARSVPISDDDESKPEYYSYGSVNNKS